jgi:putative transposase
MTNKHSFVTAYKAQYAVSTLCRHLKMSRGWFYGFLASQPARDQRQVGREARDMELLPKIETFFRASKKCYGSKRIHPLPTGEWNIHREEDLLADGAVVSERRVARIMKENMVSPLLRKRRKPKTTDSNHNMKPSPNLLEQKFHCQTPNTIWLADITYIDTDEGWLYLAGIKDMATRKIVAWAMEDHMRAELCCDALKMALGRRGTVPGLIQHSDRGSQYAGGKYRKLIKKASLTQSMSRKGECLDNARPLGSMLRMRLPGSGWRAFLLH